MTEHSPFIFFCYFCREILQLMRNIYKNIFSLLLLIAGLVIFSHAVIPHDHHYDAACETEHHEHHDDEEEGRHPMHCHFLNDIVFDDVVLIGNQSGFNIPSTDLPDFHPVKIWVYNNLLARLAILEKHNLPDYSVFIKNSPTRGSPFFLV